MCVCVCVCERERERVLDIPGNNILQPIEWQDLSLVLTPGLPDLDAFCKLQSYKDSEFILNWRLQMEYSQQHCSTIQLTKLPIDSYGKMIRNQ